MSQELEPPAEIAGLVVPSDELRHHDSRRRQREHGEHSPPPRRLGHDDASAGQGDHEKTLTINERRRGDQ